MLVSTKLRCESNRIESIPAKRRSFSQRKFNSIQLRGTQMRTGSRHPSISYVVLAYIYHLQNSGVNRNRNRIEPRRTYQSPQNDDPFRNAKQIQSDTALYLSLSHVTKPIRCNRTIVLRGTRKRTPGLHCEFLQSTKYDTDRYS